MWQKCVGGSNLDFAESIIQLSDGGYAVTGHTRSNDYDVSGRRGTTADWDFFTYRLNSNGGLIWTKCFGGTNDDYSRVVREASDGNLLVIGNSNSNNGDFVGKVGGTGNSDIILLKLNLTTGGIIWQKSYGGTQDDATVSLYYNADFGYAFNAATRSNDIDVEGKIGTTGTNDYWCVKLDDLGRYLK